MDALVIMSHYIYFRSIKIHNIFVILLAPLLPMESFKIYSAFDGQPCQCLDYLHVF